MLVLLLLFCLCVPSFSLVSRVNLTQSGPEVSRIAYGTLHLGEASNAQAVLIIIEHALSLGITTFDLSDVYGHPYEANLKLFGQAINLKPGLRKQIEIIAKMDVALGAGYDTSKAHLESVLSDYLQFLQTDYLDIVLLHRQDYLMDAGEVSQLFYEWKAAGKVLYFGTSNHDQDTFLNLNARIPLVTNEIEISVWAPETLTPAGSGSISGDTYFTNNGLLDFHYRLNQSVLAWGPLGGDPYGGINRLFKKTGTRQTQVLNALETASQSLGGEEQDVVALAWLLRHPAKIVPIIGTMNIDRITNQTRAESVAQKMTSKIWYQIAQGVGVPIP
jgi:predicted oxidoreductase